MTALPALAGVQALLCDADDCLFPSEPPAYEASAVVTNELLRAWGVEQRFGAEQLRSEYTGLNFRAALPLLALRHGIELADDEAEGWVASEKEAVTRHLAQVLRPDPTVVGPLERARSRTSLAVVSSSASARIDACLTATGLAHLFPARARFSAEDSLPRPTSKPDPAVYEHAVRSLGILPDRALAVEDSEVGVRAARAAGVVVVGLVQFVQPHERDARTRALRHAGASAVVGSWDDVVELADLPATLADPPVTRSPEEGSRAEDSARVPSR